MEEKKEKRPRIELLREKEHRSIGDIPSSILTWGYVVLAVITIALAAVWCTFR